MSPEELTRIRRENDVLRVVASTITCIYGYGPTIGDCQLGHPGCACADDILHVHWGPEDDARHAQAQTRLIAQLREDKAAVYTERSRVVAALSKCFPAVLGRHSADESWKDDWRWIVFITLPTGQCSWHLHARDLALFAHLQHDTTVRWDGHSTTEKYERLAALSIR